MNETCVGALPYLRRRDLIRMDSWMQLYFIVTQLHHKCVVNRCWMYADLKLFQGISQHLVANCLYFFPITISSSAYIYICIITSSTKNVKPLYTAEIFHELGDSNERDKQKSAHVTFRIYKWTEAA